MQEGGGDALKKVDLPRRRAASVVVTGGELRALQREWLGVHGDDFARFHQRDDMLPVMMLVQCCIS